MTPPQSESQLDVGLLCFVAQEYVHSKTRQILLLNLNKTVTHVDSAEIGYV